MNKVLLYCPCLIWIMCIICFLLLWPIPVSAAENAADGVKEAVFSSGAAPVTFDEDQLKESGIDIGALSSELHLAGGEDYWPDFEEIFGLVRSLKWLEAGRILSDWFLSSLTRDLAATGVLYREVICIVLFSAVFSAFSSAFQSPYAEGSGFLVSWMILFMVLFSDFQMMSELFSDTILSLSDILKIMIPVYTAAVAVSGNLTTGVAFYDYFMILILLLNWLLLYLFLPGIRYYFILEMFGRFSSSSHLSKLCQALYDILGKGMKLIFYLFFGAHLLESMLVPSIDLAKTGMLGRITGMIPGAGSMIQTVAGTVLASGMVVKNTLGVSVILFLAVVLSVPICKLSVYVLLNVILSIVLEPVSDRRFIECISAAGRCGLLMVYGLSMAAALLILVIAVTTMVTNQML